MISKEGLSGEDLKAIDLLLSQSTHNPPELEDIWQLVDKIWDDMGCDNKNPDWDKIDKFYRHPVWLLNGLFAEQHELSMQYRHAISDWIINKNIKQILDYGGGFGTLARLITNKDVTTAVDIYEPYPTEYAISKIADYPNIHFVKSVGKNYDCIVSVDVLEHVTDPLKLFSEMINSVKNGGCLIIANCFYPVTKCHLPCTFHLRYSFKFLAQLMGLKLLGHCKGSHATIYQKREVFPFNWRKIKVYERISQALFPFLKIAQFIYQKLKKTY